MKQIFTFLLSCVVYFAVAQTAIYDSGGKLSPAQAAYDVTFYDLDIQVKPETQLIEGKVLVQADVVHPMIQLELDLDTLLTVYAVNEIVDRQKKQCLFTREVGKIIVALDKTRQGGEKLQVEIIYGGKPRVAPRAPWDGGFQWEKTPSGAHWIATTCQGEGADIWWPCKDHVSDEPDSMRLHVRVPDPLVVASNGSLIATESHRDKTTTYHWLISNPINIYNVALNIAPYQTIETKMQSVAGDEFQVILYVLPEDYANGERLFPEILDHLQFFETYFGPYPFRADKYGVAQTPHLGMEHQTIIAYGAKFKNGSMTGGKDWGFDALHQHELSHEWWGNLVTNYDWKDMWIHEGFGSYTQPLYMEYKKGKAAYHEYINSMRFFNALAVAPRESQTADEIYRAPIYTKGARILHTLRYLIGDEVFFRALRRMAYPDPNMEKITDGRQTRFATTDDFLFICEKESGMELDWFFEVYLRQPKLPILHSKIENNTLSLSWEVPVEVPFPMPVDVQIGKAIKRIEIPQNGVKIPFEKDEKPVVDPMNWGLYEIGK